MSTALRGLAIGPGACDEAASGMGLACLGHGARPPLLTRGIGRGHQAQTLHQCAWAVQPCQIPHCRHQGHRDCQWHATQGLERLAPRRQTPGFDLLLACLGETLAAFGLLLHHPDVCLQDAVLRRGGPDDLREPPQGGPGPNAPGRWNEERVGATKLGDETGRLAER